MAGIRRLPGPRKFQGSRLKHLLIDALSVTNLSGRHVLVGHVREMATALGDRWCFTVLVGRTNAALLDDLPPGVAQLRAPVGAGWFGRALWMAMNSRRVCRALKVDAVFSPSGMLSTVRGLPQVVLAQNPWPLMRGLASGSGRAKAILQCWAFGRAHRRASVMAFNSRHMQELYEHQFGGRQGPSVVAHQGIDEALFQLAETGTEASREPIVLSVSVMARHKAVEVLVAAFAQLALDCPSARLVLVGGWPEAEYRREIEILVEQLGLSGTVRIEGHVSTAELHRLYGVSRVFCLLSRCESFGIPAVEAQSFGTPVVVAAGTAAPEIAGAGGVIVPRNDVNAAAIALRRLMMDPPAWNEFSRLARLNSARFHWPACSLPLVQAVAHLGTNHE